MSKKKRSKVRKETNRANRARRLFSNFHIEFWESDAQPDGTIRPSMFVKTSLGKVEFVPGMEDIADRALARTHNWLVSVILKLQGPNDALPYFETAEFLATDCKLNDLEDLYKQVKAEQKRSCNPHHFVDHGVKARTLSPEAVRRYREKADTSNPLNLEKI